MGELTKSPEFVKMMRKVLLALKKENKNNSLKESSKVLLEIPLDFSLIEDIEEDAAVSLLSKEPAEVVVFDYTDTEPYTPMSTTKILTEVERKLKMSEDFEIKANRKVSPQEEERRAERRQLAHKAMFLGEMIANNFDKTEVHSKADLALYEEYSVLSEREQEETLERLRHESMTFKL